MTTTRSAAAAYDRYLDPPDPEEGHISDTCAQINAGASDCDCEDRIEAADEEWAEAAAEARAERDW